MTSPFRAAPWRTTQCLSRQTLRAPPRTRYLSTTNCLRSTKNGATNPLRSRSAENPSGDLKDAKYRRSVIWSAAGIVASAAAMYGVIKLDLFGLDELEAGKNGKAVSKPHEATVVTSESRAMKMDGPPGFPSDGGPSVIPIQGQDNISQIATGNSSVPYFPTTIRLPSITGTDNKKPGDQVSTSDGDEYQLLGLGIRTVSFLSIQVYVVGLYVAKSDITELQQRLVRTAVHPPVASSDEMAAISGVGADSATSLVPPERQQLKDLLMDPEHGDAAWTALIKDDGIRTAFRVVPTRNTDFLHLRDAWVRGITARAQLNKAGTESQDPAFGSAINEFKAIVGGGQAKNIPKGQAVVLLRNAHGALDALFQPDPKATHWMGRVSDERISRFVWLNYLAGKKVSSEGARASIVDGLMTVVERPVGTLVQRVI
ncbi:Chalcone isomerase [Penicillium verhagenii]|uniref:Chalcone isomerase n=1 Tax=Penicillium verhagenii TaxID=1562060 RepID=UPI00254569AE|nr:Chalcone isomerase [Penicillium verhagenii]KAJ5924102.1 Chalcone isomerase [Penicillium verhagenii]